MRLTRRVRSLLSARHEIHPLPKQEEVRWNERVKPILDDYVKDMKAKNLPGEEALKFAQDYLRQTRSDP